MTTTERMLTQQEVFDTVRTKMKEQGEPSFESNACRMRTTDGLRCAYGCLLTDEEVAETPNLTVSRMYEGGCLLPRFHDCVKLLQEPQNAHDEEAYNRRRDGMDSPSWHERFEKACLSISNRYNLEYKELP